MVKGPWRLFVWAGLTVVLLPVAVAGAQQSGSIRGMVYDREFDVPMPLAQVQIAETGQTVRASSEGNYAFGEVPPGRYTLVFSREGYHRQVVSDVVVTPGQMTEVDASMSGDFEEMEEFVVEDMVLGSTDVELLEIRRESPGLVDSVSVETMSRAGVSNAADALALAPGATVQDGKFAVIRGLPDRYVVSMMNGVRLPTADTDKRAVELDQFPSEVIESVRITKTFTPDQQGDASGGAVDVVLKGVPDQNVFKISFGAGVLSNTWGKDNFLSYSGGGVGGWGVDDGSREIPYDRIGGVWPGAIGVTERDAPYNGDWSLSGGGRKRYDRHLTVGGFGTLYYNRGSSFYDEAVDDSWWVEQPGDPMTPQYGNPTTPQDGDFKTSLFDVTQGVRDVSWGGLLTLGAQSEYHNLSVLYMFTRSTEDKVTLAEDTRGKAGLHTYWPDVFGPEYAHYNPTDPTHPGNTDGSDSAPYLRTETLDYTERSTDTFQLHGRHVLPIRPFGFEGLVQFLYPEFNWTLAHSSASSYQPDKRLFGTQWRGPAENPGIPWLGIPASITPAKHSMFKPAANFTMGNLQRTWKEIQEQSDQYALNLTLPFEQWAGDEGYLKFGLFRDEVTREYDQESFSNFGDLNLAAPKSFEGPWESRWSDVWPVQNHRMGAAAIDVDYTGKQEISAWYHMVDLPISSMARLIGGARYESTELSITNRPEEFVTWIPPGAPGSIDLDPPSAADVHYEQYDILPSLGFVLTPFAEIMIRGSYSETVARQTFKELSPIQQMEYLGGDVFIGNPSLRMSEVKNYDLRVDYTPYAGCLLSVSWFHKEVTDPIEYVQRVANFTYTTPVNYPEGELTGWEFEIRQHLGQYVKPLEGLTVGANATLIDSQVQLTAAEVVAFNEPNIRAPMTHRAMTNAPEFLYNIYLTYDLKRYDTRLGLFYTVRGDTLVAGAGQSNGKFVPSIYETEYGTLNFTLEKRLSEHAVVSFKAKNLLDPAIERVYRSAYIGGDVTKSSYHKGMEFSMSVSVTW